jgi:CMP-N,N'-diacetyllegionaminic acid synthase
MLDFLTIIPARRNSKRVKRKNTFLIKKKELILYSFDHAISTNNKRNIIINTDDEKIIRLSKKYDLSYLKRPKKLSGSKISTEKIISHTLTNLFGKRYFEKVKNVILLQPTSPLRTVKNIKEAKKKFIDNKYDSLFSGYLSKEFIWVYEKKLKSLSYDYRNRKRTQDMKDLIFENGAIFIFSTKGFYKFQNRLFGKIGFFEMKERQSLDLDTKQDFNLLNKIIK